MKLKWFKCIPIVVAFYILSAFCPDASADLEPKILISGTSGTVQPGQSLQIQVTWPEKTIEL